jgi:HK97 gp10 family phage protein
MATIVKVEGLKELVLGLEELPKATARNVLKRVLTKAGQPTKERMESLAPRDTGYTAESIGIGPTLNPAQSRSAKKEGKFFAAIYVGSRRGSAAQFEEYGTVNAPAHPYLRPAWDATQDGALKIIQTELGTEITKAAARLARKAAKG